MKHDRLQEIRKYFYEHEKATIKELCERFGVSVETVRRDLDELAKAGDITKVYGGAVLKQQNANMPEALGSWNSRLNRMLAEKRAIAREMLKYIPDNVTIAMDSSTTILELCKLLGEKKGLTIITNNMYQATEITANTDHTVYFLGGTMKKDELITTGYFTLEQLKSFSNIDIALVSSDGFPLNSGITDYSVDMGVITKTMIEKSKKVYYIGDHTKFSIDALFNCCQTENVDLIVTDSDISEGDRKKIEEIGIELVIATI